MVKIEKTTVLSDILERPGAEEVLQNHGLPCLHCPMAKYELGMLKIGEVSEKYGLDTDVLLKELNELKK